MSDATTFLKERPVIAGGIVLAVALLAYLASRKNGSGDDTAYAFRGDAAAAIDPNAAAISQAAISAGTANIQTIAGLAGLQDTNANALNAQLAQTSAARDVSLSGISANLRAALFSTEAQRDESLAQTAAGVTVAQDANATALEQSRIYNAYQQDALATQRYIAGKQTEADIRAAEAARDAARSQAKAGFWGSLFGGLAPVLGALV